MKGFEFAGLGIVTQYFAFPWVDLFLLLILTSVYCVKEELHSFLKEALAWNIADHIEELKHPLKKIFPRVHAQTVFANCHRLYFVSKQAFFPLRLFILADLLLKPLPVWPWAFCQVGSRSGHQFRVVFFLKLPCYSSRHKDFSADTKILISKVFMEAWCHYNSILPVRKPGEY